LANGLAGDVAPVGEGLSELRVHYGPGYRVYFCKHGAEIILLCAVMISVPKAGALKQPSNWQVSGTTSRAKERYDEGL
jgi:putative component of toxin-antitoxin plasmid stabilization module